MIRRNLPARRLSIHCLSKGSSGGWSASKNRPQHFSLQTARPEPEQSYSAVKVMLTVALTISFAACTTVPASAPAPVISSLLALKLPTLFP